MRYVASLILAASVSACSVFHSAPHDAYSSSVSAPVDTVMRVARTQLQLHGYAPVVASDGNLYTTPRPLAKYQVAGDTALARHTYILRVELHRGTFGATNVDVRGYVLPRGTKLAANGLPTGAILVDDGDAALFGDVRAAGGWIVDEAKRISR